MGHVEESWIKFSSENGECGNAGLKILEVFLGIFQP